MMSHASRLLIRRAIRAAASPNSRFLSIPAQPDRASWTPTALAAAAAAAAAASVGVGYTIWTALNPDAGNPARCSGPALADPSGLPEFDREEVAKHKTIDSRVWITYKDGVYDVTDFLAQHPGGAQRLMLAAGGAIDPYWAMYAQHQTDQVRKLLEGYRIGRLKGGAAPVANPYANEPERLAVLAVRSQQPMNAETPLEMLADAMITPNELFYVRNHLPVPEVEDLRAYRLEVEGDGVRSVMLTLDDLKTKFKKHSVTATLQCTGNRRKDLMKTPGAKEVKGLAWDGAAIGTAVWSGARLSDVLSHAGLDPEDPEVAHIQFEGLDKDLAGDMYGASIPITKAMDPRGDVLLVYEMNGQPLSRDHGAPLRVVVPGVAACRSVKWVKRIIASPEESRSFWQRRDYKSFSPNVDWENVDWDSAPAIQNMPVTSQICSPVGGATVDSAGGEISVKGYAWSGGGNGVIRVDVSADGGKNWTTAELQKVRQTPGRGWAWALWQAEVAVPEGHAKGAPLTIVAKATDESYNTQPERADAIWNLRGVCCNTWPSVTVQIEE